MCMYMCTFVLAGPTVELMAVGASVKGQHTVQGRRRATVCDTQAMGDAASKDGETEVRNDMAGH